MLPTHLLWKKVGFFVSARRQGTSLTTSIAVFFPDSHAYPVYYTITHSMVDQQALSSLTVETESARGSQTAKLLLPF